MHFTPSYLHGVRGKQDGCDLMKNRFAGRAGRTEELHGEEAEAANANETGKWETNKIIYTPPFQLLILFSLPLSSLSTTACRCRRC